jgi:hypothetical protein
MREFKDGITNHHERMDAAAEVEPEARPKG